MIYLIGSLRNPEVPRISKRLRGEGISVFDEWYAAGEKADDAWRDYEKERGWTFSRAIGTSLAAAHVFEFDYKNLLRAEAAVLVCPAGKSGHLELGWCIGRGKRGYILLEPGVERWDVMYKFADGVFDNVEELIDEIRSRGFGRDEVGYEVPGDGKDGGVLV